MVILRTAPSIVTCLMLAAHFFRAGNVILAVIVSIFPVLLIFRKKWSVLAVAMMDFFAALVWIVTALDIIQERIAIHRPWGVAFAILGLAAMFSVLSGFMLRSLYTRGETQEN